MSVFALAVIGPGAESQAALAALRCAGRRGHVVVVSDRDDAVAGLGWLAIPAARRFAATATAEGISVGPRGRVVFVRPERAQLVSAARRTAARAGVPVVIALAGPRDDSADVLLAESTAVVVLAEPDGPVAELALAQLDAIGVSAVARLAAVGTATSLARFGWSVPAASGAPVPAWGTR